MKAAQISKYGELDFIDINNDAPKPILKDDKVLVEIYAVSINPFDFFIIKGSMKDYIKSKLPITIGGDFSGKIIEVGKNVVNFKMGDEVYGTAIILSGGSGAFAEIASVNPDRISIKPSNIDFIQTASLPLVGSSAIQTLEEEIKLKENQKILIHGGAGGIGSIAIQLAKYLGCYVATTVSDKDKEFVKSLGADEIIDYKTEKFEEKIKNYDAVYDTIGGEITEKSFRVLKKGGVLASMKGHPNEELAKQYNAVAVAINTKINNDHLNRLKELVEKKIVQPKVDRVFPLDQTKEAFEYKQNNHPRGKVIIKIKDSL